jgi:four helix bundle protein
MSERIESFRDLRVYQMAFSLQQEIFELTKRFPREEQYSLVDQFRRSSRAIGANIAEAWQKRRYPAHFVSKLTDADGERAEAEHWTLTAKACAYMTEDQERRLVEACRKIGGMLGRMMKEPDSWCGKFVGGR